MRRTGLKNVASPVDHNGPALVNPNDRTEFTKFNKSTTVNAPGAFRVFMISPYHLENRPSVATTITSLLLTFVSSLTRGWVVGMALVSAIASGANVMVQAFVVALVTALMFVVGMNWNWEQLLPTNVMWNISFASVGTFDLGILVWLLETVFLLGGYAAAGGIIVAITGNQAINPILPAGVTLAEQGWLYWIGGSLITFSFVFLNKFVTRYNELEDREVSDFRKKRVYRYSIRIAAMCIFGFLMAFYQRGFYFFDTGMFITAWVVSGVTVANWYTFFFVPLAMSATAILLYYLVQLGHYGSDYQEDKMQATEQRAFYAPKSKVAVF